MVHLRHCEDAPRSVLTDVPEFEHVLVLFPEHFLSDAGDQHLRADAVDRVATGSRVHTRFRLHKQLQAEGAARVGQDGGFAVLFWE